MVIFDFLLTKSLWGDKFNKLNEDSMGQPYLKWLCSTFLRNVYKGKIKSIKEEY